MATEEKPIEEKKTLSFVEQLVEQDLAEGKNAGRIQTRFPPEPNGYLHIGHAKAICMDFGVADKYNGVCNLRFDDTNPTKENNEYVENILNDISWLGFKWGNVYYASDYFEKLWDFAIWMIKNGHAYVDEQTAEDIAKQKGTPTTPGTASPFRDRPIEESLEALQQDEHPGSRRRKHGATCKARHGQPQHALPRPDYLSNHSHPAPPNRHKMERIPYV